MSIPKINLLKRELQKDDDVCLTVVPETEEEALPIIRKMIKIYSATTDDQWLKESYCNGQGQYCALGHVFNYVEPFNKNWGSVRWGAKAEDVEKVVIAALKIIMGKDYTYLPKINDAAENPRQRVIYTLVKYYKKTVQAEDDLPF